MKRIARTISAATVALGLAGGGLIAAAPTAIADVTPAEAQEFLDAHNEVRRTTAQNETARLGRQVTIPDLVWSEDLARQAQAWADVQGAAGTFDHDQNLNGVGENLAAGRDTPRGIVQRWASEVADYDYDNNSCTPGRACGHYTQVVWANTTTVGCGTANHPQWGEVQVCRYGPAGNFVGQRPYEPGAPVANPPQPENPGPQQPENPGPPQPENPGPQQPENPGPQQPENPGPQQPENPPQPENPAPANPDSFASPRILDGMNGTVTGNTAGATLEAGEPRVDGVGGASVHHSIVAPITGTLTVSTAGSTYDTAVGVGTGTSAAALTFLGTNDDANGTLQSEVTVNVTQGQQIRIVVDGFSGATGDYTLSWTFNG